MATIWGGVCWDMGVAGGGVGGQERETESKGGACARGFFFPCCLSVRSVFLSSLSFFSASEMFRLSALSAPTGESGRLDERHDTASLIQHVPWMNEMTNALFSESHLE